MYVSEEVKDFALTWRRKRMTQEIVGVDNVELDRLKVSVSTINQDVS